METTRPNTLDIRTLTPIPGQRWQDPARSVRVVSLPERFDSFASVDFLLDSLDEETSIVVDGRAVRFADRHALQSLVDARLVVLDAGGDMVVAAPSNELRATLELTGFGSLLSVQPESIDEKPRAGECTPKQLKLSGDLGPDRLDAIRATLIEMLSHDRPQIELNLVDVGSLHLGVANLLVAVRDQAAARLGGLDVIVAPNSEADRVLSMVGIVRTIRP